jgi:hypothetical protein
MSNSFNISQVNISNNKKTSSDKYFNNYFLTPTTVSSNQNDAVIAYFEKVTNGNKQSAAVLASTVIYTSLSQGVDPMSIIQQFQALKEGELSLYLAMFLNINRVGTSIVGVNPTPVQNKYISRAILP